MQATTSKLVRVFCAVKHTSHGTAYVYNGLFEDGTRRQIRKSDSGRAYVSVAQIVWTTPGYEGREEFVFSSKPSVNLNKWQRPHKIAEVPIGLDTAAQII